MVEPAGRLVMIAPPAETRHRRLAPPVFTTVPVNPPGGIVVLPSSTSRYWAETHPFWPPHTTGYQPLLIGPRTCTLVPAGIRLTIVPFGVERQFRFAPFVL